MIQLYAPRVNPTVNIILPSPDFFDIEELRSEVTVLKALDGSVYSYINTTQNKVTGSYKDEFKLTYNYTKVTREKAIEILRFIKLYSATWLKLVDYNDTEWAVKIINTAFEVSTDNRYKGICVLPEACAFTIQFSGVKI